MLARLVRCIFMASRSIFRDSQYLLFGLENQKAKHRVETFMQKKLCAIKTSQKFFTTSHFFTSTFVQWDDTFEYLLRDKTYLPKPCRYLQPTLKGINILLFSKRSSRTMEMNKIQHLSVYLEDLK